MLALINVDVPLKVNLIYMIYICRQITVLAFICIQVHFNKLYVANKWMWCKLRQATMSKH